MTSNHVHYVDCKRVFSTVLGATVCEMYASLPTSAAGRYQWEQNQRILRQGKGARAAWRATGQGETRENRVWALARFNNLWDPEWKGGPRRQARLQALRDRPISGLKDELAPDERYGRDAWDDDYGPADR